SIYHRGEEIPYQIIQTTKRSNDPIRREIEPSYASYYHEMKIVLSIKLEPLGYEVLDIVEGEKGQVSQPYYRSDNEKVPACIENEYYKIMFVDGQINVTDKQTDHVYEDFIYVEDSGDDGDNY